MRIVQLLADMQYGDAITDNALALKAAIESSGAESDIYAENIHPSLFEKVKNIADYKPADCVIHHFAIGSAVNEFVKKLDCRKILVYHNITPSHFFEGYNLKSELSCLEARVQLAKCREVYDAALAVSEYNRAELESFGFKNTGVLPILYDYSRAAVFPRKSKITNILFLGRIAPNKCQQDVIRAFYYYKKYFNKDANLYIAGAYGGMEKYLSELIHLAESLSVKDVYFTGRLSYEQMYRLYSNTDLFLCMSEHEGFCVPLVECMHYGIPILAYSAAAIPETLADSGVLFSRKDYFAVAAMMNEILTNTELKNKIVSSQKKRLKDFSEEKIRTGLFEILKSCGIMKDD